MKRIHYYLNTQLMEISNRVIQLEELNNKLQTHLPSYLREHCHVGSFNNGCMVIMVNNAAWASELRYNLPELRDALRKEAGIYQLASIKITMITLDVTKARKPSDKKLSSTARQAIKDCGEQCEYPPLKQALFKLSK